MCYPADTFSETVLYKYKKDNPPRPVKEDTNDWRGGKDKKALLESFIGRRDDGSRSLFSLRDSRGQSRVIQGQFGVIQVNPE